MGRRARSAVADVFFIQRDGRLSFTRRMPYFLLGITCLLSMNILLLIKQQPSSEEGYPIIQSDLLDNRRLRQYLEPDEGASGFPVNIPKHALQPENNFEAAEESVTAKAHLKPIAEVDRTTKRQNYNLKIYGDSPRSSMKPLPAGSYITPNEILQRTAIAIKTFNRAECLLMTVASFKDNYPDIPIFVADDSFEDVVSKNLTEQYGVTYIRLPIDSGVGFGRNRLVEHLYDMGYQYMLMSDDDYTVEQHDLLLMMAEHLIATKADAIAPLRCDYGHCERSKGMIHMSKTGELTVFPNMSSYPSEVVPTCHRSDLMQQFFLSETKTLMKVHWDNVLKNNDHYDFLFNSKRNNLRLVTCTDIQVQHNKKICQDKVKPELMENYLKVRAERWLNLTSFVFKKWSIAQLFDETGKTIHLSTDSGKPIITPVQRVVVNTTHPFRQYFEQAIIDYYNNQNAGWYSFRARSTSRKNYIVYKQLNRCMYWLGGKLEVEYDRHASFPNKVQVISFEFYHLNSSCPLAEDFWNITTSGKQGKRHVYLVTAVSNDPIHMDRLLGLVNNQTSKDLLTFVIIDMGKDTEKYDITQHKTEVDTEYVYLGGPFSRSIGLKKGFDYAKQLAEKRGQTDAIGFSIDTSILIPNNFTELIRSHVRCGVSSYAPVCFKHKEPDGYWVTTGYGMIGACFQDYDAIGGWDTRWGYRWGAEDVDIMNRMLKHLPFAVRTKEHNFEHLHSGSTRTNYKTYYTKKNLYDGDLPVTPLTNRLNDTSLAERLYKWAEPQLKVNEKLKPLAVYVTYNLSSRKTLYDVRFQNSQGEEYYAVVDSLL